MATSSISGVYLGQQAGAAPRPDGLLQLLMSFASQFFSPQSSPVLGNGAYARQELQSSNQQLGQGWQAFAGGPSVQFSPQAPGLTPNEQVRFGAPVQVANGNAATRLSTDRVTVLDRNTTAGPAGLDAQGNLVGPQGAVQSVVAAQFADDLFREKLGRDFRYDTPDGRLSIDLDANVPGPQALIGGDIQFNNRQLRATGDPDIVAHEAGHKLLFSLRPGLGRDQATMAAHEAFGDTVSLFTALRDPSVRANVLQRGAGPNLASVVGESLGGVRDLAGPGPRRADLGDPHEAGKPFGQAIYNSVMDVAGALRQGNAGMSPDQALAQANEIVSGNVIGAIDLLPQRGSAGIGTFAQAVLQSDQNQGGAISQILLSNFRNAGVL